MLNILSCTVRRLFFACMPMFVSACVTMRQCPIETLQPAKLTVESSKRNIALCASQTLFSEAIMFHGYWSDISSDSLIANILFSLKHFCEKAPGYGDAQFNIYIAKTDELPETSNFDMTIQLDKLQIKNSYYGHQYSYVEWEAYLYVNYSAKWTIRNSKGILIDEHTDHNQMEWSSGMRNGKAEAVAGLPSAKNAWWDMGIVLARNYVSRIVPQWQTDTRDIFMINKFPELSQQAYTAMMNNGYARAFNIWENMLMQCRKRGQKKMKSQIKYNMAVAWEFQNQLDEAIFWAQRSAKLKLRNQTANYLTLLRERKQHQDKLNQQLNN